MAMVMWILAFLSLASVVLAHGTLDELGIDIVNGTEAFPGQFPYMAAITGTRLDDYVCAGVLIDPNWVLTEAFCFYTQIAPAHVVLGLYDFSDFDNGGEPEIYDIGYVAVNLQYHFDDIALIKLSRPVTTGNIFIQTIALAPKDGYDYTGGICYHCGWAEEERDPDVLKFISANVLPDCGQYDPEMNICVRDGYTGTCYEDLGGPLVCRRDGITYLVGTLETSSRCDSGISIFRRMTYYSDWIRSVITCSDTVP